MVIKTTRGVFELPHDSGISIDDMSPIFNDLGSQTIPITIPATRNNARLMDFAHRIDAASDWHRRLPECVVEDGQFIRRGALNLTEASAIEGYSLNIGFDNSEAYAAWQERKLTELSRLPKVYYPSVSDLLDSMESLYRHSDAQKDDMAVFPICIKTSGDDGEVEYDLINEADSAGGLGRETTVMRIVDNGRRLITVPLGYGVSPFLRVWRVLELIFNDLGLTIDNNPFASDRDMARIVVLNNAADSCCTGTLDYADLLPSVTVKDFLKALWVRFGLVYQVDIMQGVAHLRLLRDILKSDPQCDISAMAAGIPAITYEQRQYVRLSAQTSLEMAAPGAETWQDFIKGRSEGEIYHLTDESDMAATSLTSLVHDCETSEWAWSLDGVKVSSGSSFFKWDPNPDGHQAFDLDSPDECAALRRINLNHEDTTVPMYLAGAVHRHTALRVSDGSTSDREDSEDTPLSFMLAVPRTSMSDYTTGRLTPYGRGGEPLVLHDPDDTMGPMTLLMQFAGGHFDLYWREYDEVCRHSARTVEVAMRLPRWWLMEYDMLRPVIYNGVRCLIDTISYSLPGGRLIDAIVKLRPIQTQGDYDIAAEQTLPAVDRTGTARVWTFDHDTLDELVSQWTTTQAAKQAFYAEDPDGRVDYADPIFTVIRVERTGLTPQEQDLSDFEAVNVSTASRTYTAVIHYLVECGSLEGIFFDYDIRYIGVFRAHYE